MYVKNYYSSRFVLLFIITIVLLSINTIILQDTEATESSRLKYNRKTLNIINHFDRFYDVSSIDNQIYISGHFGTVLRSTDGGENWKKLKTGTLNPLLGIEAVDENLIWAVGGNGTLIHSKDGGETWTSIESGTSEQLFEIKFISEQKGWVVGAYGVLLYTADGGKSWEDHSEKVIIPSDEFETQIDPMLNDIFFVDGQTGWLVGENGTVFNTIDGGENWSYKKITVEQQFPYLTAVFFQNQKNGIIVGEQGFLFQTENGGKDWRLIPVDTDYSLFDISGGSDSYVIVGDNGLGISVEFTETGKNERHLFSEIEKSGWISAVDVSPSGRIVACGTSGSIFVSHGSKAEWMTFRPFN